MASFTNITLFADFASGTSMSTYFGRLHVRTIAQLALLVLEVRIVCAVRSCEVIVAANHIVIWASGSL